MANREVIELHPTIRGTWESKETQSLAVPPIPESKLERGIKAATGLIAGGFLAWCAKKELEK